MATSITDPFRGGIERTLLHENYEELDERMPQLLRRLKQRRAPECFHKHGTFQQHLVGVWATLVLWKQPQHVARCGLYHSAYSNSYVNLAIFHAGTDRRTVTDDIGESAEDLVHLFCTIPRQQLIVDTLLTIDTIPEEGLVVPHLHTGVDVRIDRRTLGYIIVMTIADVGDQLFNWQDQLFSGTMFVPEASHNEALHDSWALWPGDGKPGVWMAAMSRLARLLPGCDLETLPPVFANCTGVLEEPDERKARDLYWEVVQERNGKAGSVEAERLLRECVALNPFVAEPRILLAQILNMKGDFSGARACATEGLSLLAAWGQAWDKRMGWGAWVAWCRLLQQRADKEEAWPASSWKIINFGLVE